MPRDRNRRRGQFFTHKAIAAQPDPWRLGSMYMRALEAARQLKSKQLATDLAQTINKLQG